MVAQCDFAVFIHLLFNGTTQNIEEKSKDPKVEKEKTRGVEISGGQKKDADVRCGLIACPVSLVCDISESAAT